MKDVPTCLASQPLERHTPTADTHTQSDGERERAAILYMLLGVVDSHR